MLASLLKGFALNLGLIVALGPQNTFLLRQGLRREHTFVVAFLSSMLNIPLIIIGVYGFGLAINNSHFLREIVYWGSACFLFIYGLIALVSLFKPKTTNYNETKSSKSSLKKNIACIFAFSWLNPHAILDTVVILGGVGGQLNSVQKIYYIIGASSAEFLFLFTLVYGAYFIAPLFNRPIIWKGIDIFIVAIMWFLSVSLVVSAMK